MKTMLLGLMTLIAISVACQKSAQVVTAVKSDQLEELPGTIAFGIIGGETIKRTPDSLEFANVAVRGESEASSAFLVTRYFPDSKLLRITVASGDRLKELGFVQISSSMDKYTCIRIPLMNRTSTLDIGPTVVDARGRELVGGCRPFVVQ